MNALHLACLQYDGDNLEDVVQFLSRGGIDVKAKVAESRVNALHMLCINYREFRLNKIIELLVDGEIDQKSSCNSILSILSTTANVGDASLMC